ncbi:MAG: mechanosensitive ion channel domain-containing protein [Candidatus Competibacteraceae bacterium]|jgi:potassium efflux system protein|nr:mechanosensitive ion channel domain-containing protein [Candidatus Competibacteraceae bacterium]
MVSATVLEARIAEVGDAKDLTDEARDRLIGLYRRSISNLEATEVHEVAAAGYRQNAKNAPAQIEALRSARLEILADEPLAQLDVAENLTLTDLERRLQEERADLAAVKARHDDMKARLASQQRRPTVIRQRLVEAAAEREAVSAALSSDAPEDGSSRRQGPKLAEAQRWELETRYRALSTEIKMLDQELLSRAVRLDLLEAKRDRYVASIDWIAARVTALEERTLAQRRQAAGQARADAEQVRRDIEGMDPVLIRLSEANVALGQAIDELVAELHGLDQARAKAERLTERMGADYRDTRNTLESGVFSDELGAILLQQLDAMPDFNSLQQQQEQRRSQLASWNTRRLGYRAEARRLSNVETVVSELHSELQTGQPQAQQERLRGLVTQRLVLLDHMLETEELYLDKTKELDAAEDALLAVAADYEAQLLERLAWLRTEAPIDLDKLLALPNQLNTMLAADRTTELGRIISRQLAANPLFWGAVLLVGTLLWSRRRIRTALEGLAGRVGKPSTDRFGLTLRVLGLTLLLALPLPLLLAASGWLLLHTSQGTDLTLVVGDRFLEIAGLLLTLQLLSAICRPNGLAAVHFCWPKPNLTLARTTTRRLTWTLVPAVVLMHFAVVLDPLKGGGTMGRLAAIVAFGTVAWFMVRVFHPRRGVTAQLRHPDAYPLLMGSYWLWYPALVLYPVVMIVLAWSGYLYTATVEANNYQASMQLILAVVLLEALALRWLLVVRRRLSYEAALERYRVASEAAQSESREPDREAVELRFEEPQVEFSTLSADTRILIRYSLAFVAIIGFVLIWSDTLSALRVFEDHVLWNKTVSVGGEEQQQPVTLLHLGLALLFAAGTLVLLRRMPALLEIILLQRSALSTADRYAVTTLTSYVIGAIGILLVLGTLGVSWTHLQWMAAALSVGIGFGLQEIVANFVSGLIILFERPIRLGDTVTVGDTDGVVTKIRIRATTIRNWDRKELLVPNKEFVTGRLLNWSLSDPVTRIMLEVGVAYGSDVKQASAIMTSIALANEHVINEPPPVVTFDTFGDNALTLTLRAFVGSIDVRLSTISALHRDINEAFADAGISIAFPQRDLHLDTARPLQIELRKTQPGADHNDQ